MNVVEQDERLKNVELHAGHVKIVGDHKIAPRKLINILQNNGYMSVKKAKQKEELERLFTFLYELR